MSLWSRIKAGLSAPFEKRASLQNPTTWLIRAFGGQDTLSGIQVDDKNCMESTAFFAGVNQIAEAIGSLPLVVYRKAPDGSRTQAVDHPLYSLLRDAPNDWMPASVWKETSMYHALVKSNAFSQIVRDAGDRAAAFIPLDPTRVTAKMLPSTDGGAFEELVYIVTGVKEPVKARDILHIRALSWTGIMGRSRIEMGKEAVGLDLCNSRFAAAFYKNGAVPSMVLLHQGELTDEAYDRMKRDWKARYGGVENAHSPAILEEGTQVKELGVDPEKAQALESRKESVRDMARLLKMPPHMLADLDRATFSNIEEMSLQYVTYTLVPWLVRWEQEINLKAFSKAERAQGYFVEFNTAALLKGDLKSRYEAYAMGRTGGWLSRNDIRKFENLDPIQDGDDYLTPLNMGVLGKETQKEGADVVVDPEADTTTRRLRAAR